MKRLVLSILAIALAFSAAARTSEEILAQIRAAQNGGKTIEFTPIVEVRTNYVGHPGSETLTGKLKFVSKDDFLVMNYDNKEDFVIQGKQMVIKKNGQQPQVFDLSKNMMMKGLSRTLLCSFRGTLEDLAKEQKSSITAVEDGKNYKVTLTATKKQPRGLAKVEVVYKQKGGDLVSIYFEEFTGAKTSYNWE